MDRTTAPNSVSGAYVDDNPSLGVTGTLLIATDRNQIQEELVQAIEGAGLTPSAANDGQLLEALRKGAGSTFDADKLDGQEGSFYRDAANLNAGTIPSARLSASDLLTLIKTVDGSGSGLDADLLDGQSSAYFRNADNLNAGTVPSARLSASDLLTLIKTVDGSGSGLDADLWDGQTQAQMVLDFVYPVGCYYTQYPDASSNTDATEFPTAQRPATFFGGTWAEQWSTTSIYFRTRGTLSDTDRSSGLQQDAFQGHRHTIQYDNGGGSSTVNLGSLNLGDDTKSGDFTYLPPVTDGTNGTPRTATETRVVNRRIKVWKRTA